MSRAARPPVTGASGGGGAGSGLVEEWTYDHLVRQLCDFLCVAIHSILSHRRIYPADQFEQARVYRIAAPRARHPLLAAYINDAVAAVADELRRNVCKAVQVLILPSLHGAGTEHTGNGGAGGGGETESGVEAADGPVYERFVFDLSDLPHVEQGDWHTPLRGTVRDVVLDDQLEHQFRAALLKIATVSTTLGDLPDGCTFAIAIDLRDEKAQPAEVERWLPDPLGAPQGSTRGDDSRSKGKTILPVRTVDFATLKFAVWMEETAAKLKLPIDPRQRTREQVSQTDTQQDTQPGSSLGKRRIEDLSF